jgi:Tetrapyrrole (Corrin/Porphyrin) Methylases
VVFDLHIVVTVTGGFRVETPHWWTLVMSRGSLVIVGTGINTAGHVTTEARAYMERAQKLFYLVADPTTEYYLRKLNETAESLYRFYETGKERLPSYRKMATHIVNAVRQGGAVCAAFYGHPGVFAFPSHEAIRQARAEGFSAKMLPGISAEDCLFADLGIDPAWFGCQSFEATDFLVFKRRFDVNSSLILWQIGSIGDVTYRTSDHDLSGLSVLANYLTEFYGEGHTAVVYEASHYAFCDAMIQTITLGGLHNIRASGISTLYVPPKGLSPLDKVMAGRLASISHHCGW